MRNILFIIIFISLISSAFAGEIVDEIYTWGVPDKISYDSGINEIHSYDGFDYFFKSNGSFVIKKDGIKQATYGFGMKGTYNESSIYALSNDYVWEWTVIENNSDRIEIEGKRENYDSVPFKWKISLVVEKDKPFKILNYIENTTANDVTDLEFFYIFDVNTIANPTVEYVDENRTVKNYSYNTNILRNDEEGLSNITLNQISIPFFNFNFQDMINENYFLTYLYFGNLNDLKNLLPDSNGFVIGFSKGNKRLNVGQSYTIDPTVEIDESYLWTSNLNVQFGTYGWSKVSDGGDLVRIYDRAPGNSLRRGYVQFDITSIPETVIDANFIWNNTFNETDDREYTFTVNTTSDFTYASTPEILYNHGVGTLLNTFDFFRSPSWMSINIKTILNTAINNGDANISFIFVPVNENRNTEVTSRHDGYTPKIEYRIFNTVSDLNIVTPNAVGFNIKTGDIFVIDLNIVDGDTDATNMLLDLNFSSSNVQGTGTVIINDANMANTVGLVCDTNNFVTVTQCHYSWDTTGVSDGNYFISGLVNDGDNTVFDVGDNNFLVDGTKPITVSDVNAGVWQNTDANVFLTCSDSGSGCNITQFRIDSDDTNSISMGSWQTYDANVFFNLDGNFAFDFNSSDVAENLEDTNRQFVLIDKTAPTTISNISSGVAQPGDVNVVLTCSDSGSGCFLTQYRLDTDSSSGVSFDAWTVFNSNILITADGNFSIDFNSSDVAGNFETTNTQDVVIARTQPQTSTIGGTQPPPPSIEEIEEGASFKILDPEDDFTLFYVLTFPAHQKFKIQNLTNRELNIDMTNDLPNSAYHTIYSDWDGRLDANSTEEFYISFLFNRSMNTNQINLIFTDNTPGDVSFVTRLGFFTPADELPGTVVASTFELFKIDFLRNLFVFDLNGGFVLGWVILGLLLVLSVAVFYKTNNKTRILLLFGLFGMFSLFIINFFVFPMPL